MYLNTRRSCSIPLPKLIYFETSRKSDYAKKALIKKYLKNCLLAKVSFLKVNIYIIYICFIIPNSFIRIEEMKEVLVTLFYEKLVNDFNEVIKSVITISDDNNIMKLLAMLNKFELQFKEHIPAAYVILSYHST